MLCHERTTAPCLRLIVSLQFLLSVHILAAAEAVGPWNLSELHKAPAMRWVSQTGAVHSVLYAGEKFKGANTEVFAFYASPATLGEAKRPSPAAMSSPNSDR